MAEISSKRFGESSKQEIDKIIEQTEPKNTKNNRRYVWNQFQQFCNERGYELTKETPTLQIGTILADWAINMRRSNGEEYKEYTVKTMWNVTAKIIQEKYFAEYQRKFNPFSDQEFKRARDARKAKRKQLQTIPEKRKVSSKALKSEHYQLMIDSCNENTPEGLQFKFFLIASLELGWRGSDGSNCLLYYFQEDVNNDEISPRRIAYNPEFSRTSQGGDLMLPGTKWLTENKEITSKCPVKLFNLLLKKRTQKIKTDYFFITPSVSYQKTGEWYKDIPLQRNELLNWTKTYAKKTQLKTNSRRIAINSVRSLAKEQKLIYPVPSYQKTGERYKDLSLHCDLSNLTKNYTKKAPCAKKTQLETHSQMIIVNSVNSLAKKQELIKITRSMRPILPKPYVVINQQCNSTVVNELSGKQLSPIEQSEMGTLPCPLCCDNKFSSRLSLKHHLLEIESKIQCPDCCERFCSILELANHLGGQCWKPTEVIEIKNEVLDTKEFLEGYYKSEDDQIAGNIADDSNSPLQEVESVISGLTEESTSQMAIDPLDNMAVMTKSEVDSDSEDSLSFKAEMDVENVEEFKIDEPSSHQHRPIILKMDKRRIEKKPYDGKTLETGVRKVLQEDWSVYKTSKFYGIPWTTLKENVLKASKHFNINTNELNKFELGKVGRPFALSSGIEQQLATYIIKMQECGFGLTVLHIRKLAYKLAEKAGVAGRFNPERKTAGKKWYLGFKERYNLTLRKPENLSRYQASCANQTLIQGFYDCLEKVLDEHNLRESPNQIWNCDETGMMFVTAGSKIVTSLGKKYIYRRVYAEKGTTTTVLGSANAAGKSGPFLIIFKGIQNIPALKSGANCDATVAVTPKGWISSELFVKWMQEFIKSLPPERPVILLMDSHASHLSPEAIQLAEDNSIILITFPSHTTHQLQPLDLCVYKSLKAAWSSELDTETRRNPGKTPSRYDFHRLFNPCYEKSFCPKIIKSGFNKAGIVPFDRNAVSPEALVPSSVSENPEEGNRPNEIQTNDEILPIPVCDQTPIRNTRRKSQSARVDTISPTVSADPQPGPSSARLNQGPRARNVMETPNGTENSVCPVCSLDYQHDLRNSTGAQWIQCCFCLKWYHNKCEGLGDNFDEDVYMCSSCED